MRKISKYALSASAAIVLSLTLAGVVAKAAQCTMETSDEYTCYVTGEDENYCYYQCYCKVSSQECRSALERDGFEIIQ